MSGLKKTWDKYPTLALLLPIAIFMLVGALEPKPDAEPWLGLSYAHYPLIYSIKTLLTAVALALVWPKIRELPWRLSWLGLGVGLVGGLIWIGVCSTSVNKVIVDGLGLQSVLGTGERSAFNPLHELADTPVLAWGFLAIRFVGLVVVIAIAEELFLRGWLVRYFSKDDWTKVPFGQVDAMGVALCIIVPVLMHPAELVAAALWFGLVTWLMVRTRSFGDCVMAHATTNLMLGIYVLVSGRWELW